MEYCGQKKHSKVSWHYRDLQIGYSPINLEHQNISSRDAIEIIDEIIKHQSELDIINIEFKIFICNK
jgi:hypothetical protein